MRTPTDSTLIAVLLTAAVLAASPAGAARSYWREMTVGHFHLYSTLSDNPTRNIAVPASSRANSPNLFRTASLLSTARKSRILFSLWMFLWR